MSSLKHSFEKVGDHWEAKSKKGPSDHQAAKGGAAARRSKSSTAGGVDANASKEHLREVAKGLEVKGRSKMDKRDLVKAIEKANRSVSAKSRRKERSP